MPQGKCQVSTWEIPALSSFHGLKCAVHLQGDLKAYITLSQTSFHLIFLIFTAESNAESIVSVLWQKGLRERKYFAQSHAACSGGSQEENPGLRTRSLKCILLRLESPCSSQDPGPPTHCWLHPSRPGWGLARLSGHLELSCKYWRGVLLSQSHFSLTQLPAA